MMRTEHFFVSVQWGQVVKVDAAVVHVIGHGCPKRGTCIIGGIVLLVVLARNEVSAFVPIL